MEIKELEQIKKTIAAAELRAAKADGVIEKIKAEWKENYGVDTVEDAQKELDTLSEKITKHRSKQKTLLDELEAMEDWDKLSEELNW